MSSPESDLFAAIDTDDRLTVATALDSGIPIDARGPLGRTACFLAAAWCRTESLCLLIERGADVELPDECGNTPLMVAVIEGNEHAEVMGILLRAGADPMRPNLAGATPALLATTLSPTVRQMFPTDPNQQRLPGLETVESTPSVIRLLVGEAPLSIGGELVIRDGERVRILHEQELNQSVGGEALSARVKAHIRCYLVAGGSPIES